MTHRLLTSVRVASLAATIGVTTAGAQETVPADLLITLERTECYGTCPAYSVTIDAKGNVTYRGLKLVRVGGRRSDQIPVSRVADLWAAAERIRFFELRNRYSAMITDLPTTFVKIKGGGRSKRVEDYVAGPDELKELQRLIDETARTKRWVSLDEGMLQQLIREGWSPSANEKSTRLRRALQEDDVPVVKGLLAIGADPNGKSDVNAPLMSARSAAAARALLDAGASPFSAARDGRTPLWSAACYGSAGAVSALLKAGADPNVQVRGVSALKCAQQARDSARSRPPSPFMGKGSVVVDFDAVIALLEEASVKQKNR